MRVYALTITRAATPERVRLLLETLTKGRETAAYEFDWHVHVNGSPLAMNICESARATRIIQSFHFSGANIGQHPPMNDAIEHAMKEGYDYFLRIDDDVEWLTKRWLAKLIEASKQLGDGFVLSPKVLGLRWQPPQSDLKEVEQIPIKFIDGPIGGICRLMPTAILKKKPYVSDVRLPMGGGDAAGVGEWATKSEPLVFLAYCQHIRIRHAKSTDTQEAEDPLHFKEHDLYQYVPYIPV